MTESEKAAVQAWLLQMLEFCKIRGIPAPPPPLLKKLLDAAR